MKINFNRNTVELIEVPKRRHTIRKSKIDEIIASKTPENKIRLIVFGDKDIIAEAILANTEANWLLYEKLSKEVFK